MKIFNYLSKLSLTAVMTISSVFPAIAQVKSEAVVENPFTSGTGIQRLTPELRAQLLEYAENSLNLINRALEKANGLTLSEAKSIYVSAAIRVVKNSYERREFQELLMRQILNQALEMTVGVPNPDGSLDTVGGILKNTVNQELVSLILEDSLKLAKEYYSEDRDMLINAQNNAPVLMSSKAINEMALSRLHLTRKWGASIFEWSVNHHFLAMSLQHWFNVVNSGKNLHKACYAEEITRAEEALIETSRPIEDANRDVPRAVRVIRNERNQIYQSLLEKRRVCLK